MSGGGGVGGGRGVGAPETGNTESGGLVACREEGVERHENGLHPGHIPLTYIRYTVRGRLVGLVTLPYHSLYWRGYVANE